MSDKTNHYPKITALAATFPTLDKAPTEPFDPVAFEAWACGPAPSSGGRYAAQFILAVFNNGSLGDSHDHGDDGWGHLRFTYECGPFDIVDALSTWDATHRAAFVAWASDPWWP